MAKVKTLGKAYTEYKRTMPDRGWDTVYSQPLRALIYNCFLKGRPFEPESIVFSSAQGWELASGLTVSKVGTIKISDRPHLRSYRNGIHLADVGIPTTLKLTLSRADEWSARVGVNTGDRIIAISTWNDECGHHCDENISVGDLVEKVDVRTYHEIEEPIYAWCHTDCICPICDTVWPGCDGHSDEDDDGEVDEGGDYE